MGATQTITSYGQVSSGARREGTSASVAGLYINPDVMRQTEYIVYLHSISKRSFQQQHSIYGNLAIPACPFDKRSYCFFKVRHPVPCPQLNPDDVNGEPIWRFENAKKVALGICNPGYAGTDLTVQDKELNAENVIASGECNLNRQGIFASMNEVPTEEELKRAEARREVFYRFCLNEGDTIAKSKPHKLHELLTEDHRMAADYFGVETTWRQQPVAKVSCPNCGSKIPQGVAFHYDNGRVCVLDWERSWLAGAVKKEDVPEPKQWEGFHDEPVKRGPGRPRKEEV